MSNNKTVKKIGNGILNWLNGQEEEEENTPYYSFFQRTAVNQNTQQSHSRSNLQLQQLYDTRNSPVSPLDARSRLEGETDLKSKRQSRFPLKRSSVDDEEIDDYDFYSADHLDKIFDVVIEIQEEYEKRRKEEEKIMQSRKADQQKLPKALLNPEVQRQIKKQKTYKPYFLYTLTIVQIIVMILELIVNWVKLDTPIDVNSQNFNIMIGPSTSVLIHFGARWVPCMRSGFENLNITCIPGVEDKSIGQATLEDNSVVDICKLSDLCGMGMSDNETPNQWWRFITPIFLHAGIVHILTNLFFQIRVGFQMERDFGTLRIFIIYVSCGIAGFMFGAEYSVQTPSVGCSGSLYGLIACLLLDLLLNWKLLIKPVRELMKMLFVIIISLGIGFLPFVDNFAHVGGFMTGLIVGLIFLPSIKFSMKDRIIKNTITILCIPLFFVLMISLIVTFYNSESERCKWCKYANCLPINGWCDEYVAEEK